VILPLAGTFVVFSADMKNPFKPFQCHFLGFRVKFPPLNSSMAELSQCYKASRFFHLPNYLSLSALTIFNMVDRWRRNITLCGFI